MPRHFPKRFARVFALAGVAASTLGAVPARAAPSDVAGTWLTEDGRARVRLDMCGPKQDKVCGFVVWMETPNDEKGHPLDDPHNPDPAKRHRHLLGHEMIHELTRNEDQHFAGQIYDADNGKSYDVTLWREDADQLKVKGCLLSVLCKSQLWKKTTDVLPGQLPGPATTPGATKAGSQ